MMLEFIQGEVAVDAYVDHAELEAFLKRRLAAGWTLVQTLGCEPSLSSPARDMLTLIWNKMPKAHSRSFYEENAFAEPMVVR